MISKAYAAQISLRCPGAFGKENTITQAHTLLCYLAVRKLMISCADVARALNISPATVIRATGRGVKLSNLEQIPKEPLVF